ncbi:unnamed protein product [Cylindrotheca closterium]|uniref:RING-type domain-containing protein n=1 Tax=Cylindrotheca closterium TaxID=2856 RepID=A0AAD2CMK2_9STRA|nr:unnamed protein product [Cylindrotheca closterium]
MVVPNIRNPNRYRSLEVATSTKSHYHLEPDYAFAYRHVGRRTKGGRGGTGAGGGFFYGGAAYRSNGNGDRDSGGRAGIIVGALIGVFAVIMLIACCACRKSENTRRVVNNTNHADHDAIRATRDSVNRQRNQRTNNNAPSNDNATSANVYKSPSGGNPISYVTMKSSFHIQTVLPDKRNIDPNVLREEAKMGDTARDEDSVVENGDPPGKGGVNNNDNHGANNSHSSRFPMSIWRRSTANDECSICLQSYEPGQTICLAKNTNCKHVFHQDCIEEWLRDHSDCPLCRVTLVCKPL